MRQAQPAPRARHAQHPGVSEAELARDFGDLFHARPARDFVEIDVAGLLLRAHHVDRAVAAADQAFVAAAFYPEPQARPLSMQADLALSDQLVGELFDHDLLLISTPMYNFSVPSGLKAWVDQIVRLGLTFDHTLDNGVAQYTPLLQGKKALIVTSRGGFGFGPGGELEALNHADPWLRTALGFIGINDVSVVAAEGEESAERTFAVSVAEAEQRLLDLARRF